MDINVEDLDPGDLVQLADVLDEIREAATATAVHHLGAGVCLGCGSTGGEPLPELDGAVAHTGCWEQLSNHLAALEDLSSLVGKAFDRLVRA